MNIEKLKRAENQFMEKYPGGFNHPDMVAIGKKHKMDKMVTLAQTGFSKEQFDDPDEILMRLSKIVTQSSMVSLFEKPKFRDFILELSRPERDRLIQGVFDRLHGNAQKGFETMLSVLKEGKLAKWSLISILPAYFLPSTEVFVKPTTAKGIIQQFELEGLTYHPTPTWDFYQKYKTTINHMKTKVSPDLSPSNAAFSGFLMMSLT